MNSSASRSVSSVPRRSRRRTDRPPPLGLGEAPPSRRRRRPLDAPAGTLIVAAPPGVSTPDLGAQRCLPRSDRDLHRQVVTVDGVTTVAGEWTVRTDRRRARHQHPDHPRRGRESAGPRRCPRMLTLTERGRRVDRQRDRTLATADDSSIDSSISTCWSAPGRGRVARRPPPNNPPSRSSMLGVAPPPNPKSPAIRPARFHTLNWRRREPCGSPRERVVLCACRDRRAPRWPPTRPLTRLSRPGSALTSGRHFRRARRMCGSRRPTPCA